ncbi:DUF6036 family nucleotidyltransferase [Pseudomonas nunensis]|uniref:DUF6036 family nucleotidyltransferase n=1 Tax=Pseudomonas nunensis TaxID=2961896 RepID=A0ABY5EBK8_9PSED|nr:DUF6036 family nucleotidyltransferase [Pseudomonas nunensis]KPN93032.1 hypothetical protein AL066_17015 [Pseudomonas nunensis]MCL5228838.1 DUF6036 family nucleotidyltransferase [Pseudomonas nunensis]UTO12165.1 DUF6036 family nucleotidyltransferase [Pseudomonas nunensis]
MPVEVPDVLPAIVDTSKPLGQAVVAMFKGVQEELDGYPSGSVKIIIFGGVAVHLYTHHRVSVDIDGEIFHCDRSLSKAELIESLGATPESFIDPTGRTLALNYDLTFNTTLGPLHEDYLERAIRLEEFDEASPIHIWIAAPLDLAISKLGRATDQDIEDIEKLLRMGLILTTDLNRLALQAIDVYVGNKEPPYSILKRIIADYLETNDDDEAP